MRFVLLLISASCVASCASDPPAAQPIGALGSRDTGLVYVERACSSCHAVGSGETASPNAAAPPFEEIANAPGMTGLALHVWLQSPHENMPMIMVEPEHVDDVWAYMSSLRHE